MHGTHTDATNLNRFLPQICSRTHPVDHPLTCVKAQVSAVGNHPSGTTEKISKKSSLQVRPGTGNDPTRNSGGVVILVLVSRSHRSQRAKRRSRSDLHRQARQ